MKQYLLLLLYFYFYVVYSADGELNDGLLPEAHEVPEETKELDYYRNGYYGTLPSSWGQLTQLTYIGLAWNHLEGTLPHSWANLTNLEYLSLHHNSLTSTLPKEWKTLTSLESLGVRSNQLTGIIPREIVDLASLTVLSLRDNDWCCPIPRFDHVEKYNDWTLCECKWCNTSTPTAVPTLLPTFTPTVAPAVPPTKAPVDITSTQFDFGSFGQGYLPGQETTEAAIMTTALETTDFFTEWIQSPWFWMLFLFFILSAFCCVRGGTNYYRKKQKKNEPEEKEIQKQPTQIENLQQIHMPEMEPHPQQQLDPSSQQVGDPYRPGGEMELQDGRASFIEQGYQEDLILQNANFQQQQQQVNYQDELAQSNFQTMEQQQQYGMQEYEEIEVVETQEDYERQQQEQYELEMQEMERQEFERQEFERQEFERQEFERQELEQQQEIERLEIERKQEMERLQEIERVEIERREELERLQEIERLAMAAPALIESRAYESNQQEVTMEMRESQYCQENEYLQQMNEEYSETVDIYDLNHFEQSYDKTESLINGGIQMRELREESSMELDPLVETKVEEVITLERRDMHLNQDEFQHHERQQTRASEYNYDLVLGRSRQDEWERESRRSAQTEIVQDMLLGLGSEASFRNEQSEMSLVEMSKHEVIEREKEIPELEPVLFEMSHNAVIEREEQVVVESNVEVLTEVQNLIATQRQEHQEEIQLLREEFQQSALQNQEIVIEHRQKYQELQEQHRELQISQIAEVQQVQEQEVMILVEGNLQHIEKLEIPLMDINQFDSGVNVWPTEEAQMELKELAMVEKKTQAMGILQLQQSEQMEVLELRRAEEQREMIQLQQSSHEMEVLKLRRAEEQREMVQLQQSSQEMEVLHLRRAEEQREMVQLIQSEQQMEALQLKQAEDQMLQLRQSEEQMEALQLRQVEQQREALELKQSEEQMLRAKADLEQRRFSVMQTEVNQQRRQSVILQQRQSELLTSEFQGSQFEEHSIALKQDVQHEIQMVESNSCFTEVKPPEIPPPAPPSPALPVLNMTTHQTSQIGAPLEPPAPKVHELIILETHQKLNEMRTIPEMSQLSELTEKTVTSEHRQSMFMSEMKQNVPLPEPEPQLFEKNHHDRISAPKKPDPPPPSEILVERNNNIRLAQEVRMQETTNSLQEEYSESVSSFIQESSVRLVEKQKKMKEITQLKESGNSMAENFILRENLTQKTEKQVQLSQPSWWDRLTVHQQQEIISNIKNANKYREELAIILQHEVSQYYKINVKESSHFLKWWFQSGRQNYKRVIVCPTWYKEINEIQRTSLLNKIRTETIMTPMLIEIIRDEVCNFKKISQSQARMFLVWWFHEGRKQMKQIARASLATLEQDKKRANAVEEHRQSMHAKSMAISTKSFKIKEEENEPELYEWYSSFSEKMSADPLLHEAYGFKLHVVNEAAEDEAGEADFIHVAKTEVYCSPRWWDSLPQNDKDFIVEDLLEETQFNPHLAREFEKKVLSFRYITRVEATEFLYYWFETGKQIYEQHNGIKKKFTKPRFVTRTSFKLKTKMTTTSTNGELSESEPSSSNSRHHHDEHLDSIGTFSSLGYPIYKEPVSVQPNLQYRHSDSSSPSSGHRVRPSFSNGGFGIDRYTQSSERRVNTMRNFNDSSITIDGSDRKSGSNSQYSIYFSDV